MPELVSLIIKLFFFEHFPQGKSLLTPQPRSEKRGKGGGGRDSCSVKSDDDEDEEPDTTPIVEEAATVVAISATKCNNSLTQIIH